MKKETIKRLKEEEKILSEHGYTSRPYVVSCPSYFGEYPGDKENMLPKIIMAYKTVLPAVPATIVKNGQIETIPCACLSPRKSLIKHIKKADD